MVDENENVQVTLETKEKPWWMSRTLWGASIAVYSGILGLAGYAGITPEDQKQLVDLLVALGPIIGGILAVVGRVYAQTKLGK